MKKIVLFILCLLFGLMYINGGLNKFFNYMPPPKDMPEKMMKVFGAFMTISWLMPLVGLVEIVGGLLIIFPKTRALGAIVVLPVTVGIVLTNFINDGSGFGMGMGSALMLINILAIADNWRKYQPMIK